LLDGSIRKNRLSALERIKSDFSGVDLSPLKEYRHWVLEVSYRQHALGCYIIFAKKTRPNLILFVPVIWSIKIIKPKFEAAILLLK